MNAIEQYIRQAAISRGIDPDVAVRVARAEGGLKDPVRQSLVTKGGRREPSFGPFQLLVGGGETGFPEGMGNRALARGIDPRDPSQWQRGVDFALDNAKSDGWRQWYGAKAAGIDRWGGIKGGGVTLNSTPATPDGPKGQEKYLPPLSTRTVNDYPVAETGAFPPAPAEPTMFERFKANAFSPNAQGKTPFNSLLGLAGKMAGGGKSEQLDITPSGLLQSSTAEDASRMQAAQALMAQLMQKRRGMV